jgi:hypothetical protein
MEHSERERGEHPAPRAPRASAFRLALAALGCLTLLALAAGVLWWQDWRYSLPTPRPAGLVQAAIGTRVPLASVAAYTPGHPGRPMLLHFFNPRCPCSRFNLDHVRELQAEYAGRVDFVAVVQGCKPNDAERSLARLGLHMRSIADPDGRLAQACGVYASPQAVVLDREGRLYYRGNYNASRYCTTAASEFARLALDSLAAGAPPPSFAGSGLSYGCELPSWRPHHG